MGGTSAVFVSRETLVDVVVSNPETNSQLFARLRELGAGLLRKLIEVTDGSGSHTGTITEVTFNEQYAKISYSAGWPARWNQVIICASGWSPDGLHSPYALKITREK
ncbi:MAG: hypothetical protein HYT16_04630 [DPANN group archaeon]|nr:hypothetical protein [DPANN group archaeon]